MSDPVCAIVGVGPGNGAAFARTFRAVGYRIAVLVLTGQPRPAWSFEIDLRPYGKSW